jgi:hypothetical protein
LYFQSKKDDAGFNYKVKGALNSIKLKSISFTEESKGKIIKYDILKKM